MTENEFSRELKHELKQIPIRHIFPDAANPRKNIEEGIDEFAESLKSDPTIYVPIIVQKVSGRDYKIIDGQRRYTAAKKAGFRDLLCDVLPESVDKDSMQLIRIRIDSLHKAWDPLTRVREISTYYKKWLQQRNPTLAKNKEITFSNMPLLEQFALWIGLSSSHVRNILKVSLSEAAMNRLEGGESLRMAIFAVEEEEERPLRVKLIEEIRQPEMMSKESLPEVPYWRDIRDEAAKIARAKQLAESDVGRASDQAKYNMLTTSKDIRASITILRRHSEYIAVDKHADEVNLEIQRCIEELQDIKLSLISKFE